ncbi:hypothetical protein [Streptomyces aureus]
MTEIQDRDPGRRFAAEKLDVRQVIRPDQPNPAAQAARDPQARRADEKGKTMTRYRKTTRALTAGAALLGALVLSAPAQAADRTSIVVYGADMRAKAVSFGANGAVRVCDTDSDGYGVAVRYYRKVGDPQTLYDSRGNGLCTETTDIRSNPIVLFTACVVIDHVDYCASPYQDTGR